MTSRSVVIAAALLFLTGASAACSNSSAPQTYTFYNAAVSLGDDDTSIELVKLVADEAGGVSTESLGAVALGYSALPFLVGQGSIPEGSPFQSASCSSSPTMGIDRVPECVIGPVLAGLDLLTAPHGLAQDQAVVTASYDVSASLDYTVSLIQSASEGADAFVEQAGYTSEIVPDPTTELLPADARGDDAYNYSRDVEFRPPRAADWMSDLRPDARLSQLSIAGTHDSLAWRNNTLGGSITQTQSMDVPTQLRAGIRFLDIRLRCLSATGGTQGYALFGYHGISNQHISLIQVLNEIQAFLSEHPDETVYARFRNEAGGLEKDQWCQWDVGMPGPKKITFRDVFKSNFEAYPALFWRSPGPATGVYWDPTLGETRGRIVAMTDFYDGVQNFNFGLFWGGNAKVQDDYQIRTNENYVKWERVKGQLHAASNVWDQAQHDIYVNFLSASGSFSSPVAPFDVASGQVAQPNGSPARYTGIDGCRGNPPISTTWVDFPRQCTDDKTKAQKKACYHTPWCKIYFQGMNRMTVNYLANGNIKGHYLGIVVSDFPGGKLIWHVNDVNRHTLLKTP